MYNLHNSSKMRSNSLDDTIPYGRRWRAKTPSSESRNEAHAKTYSKRIRLAEREQCSESRSLMVTVHFPPSFALPTPSAMLSPTHPGRYKESSLIGSLRASSIVFQYSICSLSKVDARARNFSPFFFPATAFGVLSTLLGNLQRRRHWSVKMTDVRRVSFHLIRSIAAFSVCCIHAMSEISSEDHPDQIYVYAARSLFKFATPLFFLTAGALNLRDEPLGLQTILKRFMRLVWQALIWTGVYIIADAPSGAPFVYFKNAIIVAAYAPTHYHLWFLYEFFASILMFPLWQAIARSPDVYIYLCVWVVFGSLLPFCSAVSWFHLTSNRLELYVKNFSGFFVCGTVIDSSLYSHKLLRFAYVGVFLSWFGTFLGAHLSRNPIWWDYMSPSLLLGSMCAFLVLRHGSLPSYINLNLRLVSLIEMISSATLGIYLMHPLIMIKLLDWFDLRPILREQGGIHYCILFAGASFLLSLLATLGLLLVPFGKRVV